MEDFPKNIKIEMQPDNIASIRAALQRYAILMHSAEAFQPADFSTFLNVEFVVADNETLPRRLQYADVGLHYPLLETCFALNDERRRPNLEHRIEFGDEQYISEPLFFAHALQFPELKEDIIAAAKAMIYYARGANNTDNMWVDDMHVFGLESLYMLARVYPECSWLLAQLHIPYWDFEHVVCSGVYINALAEQYDWSRDMIKAYLWCDNATLRQCFYGHVDCGGVEDENLPNLATHLKEHPADYTFFKQTLIDRFKQEPVLAYTNGDDEEDEQPVFKFYQTLQLNWGTKQNYSEDDEDELAQQFFIEDTLENEAGALQELIEQAIDTPLIKIAASRVSDLDDDEDDDYFIQGQGTEILQEFFIKGIDNGVQIWAYITQGVSADVLNDIEPVDIIKLVAEKKLRLKKKTDWFIGALDTLDEQLVDVLGDYLYDLFDDEDDEDEDDEDEAVSNSGFIVSIQVRKDGANEREDSPIADNTQSGQQLLRTLDVFKVLMDVEELNDEVRELVVEDHELLSDEAFDRRFGSFTPTKALSPEQIRSKTVQDLSALVDDIFDSKIDQDHLQKFDRYVERDRDALLDLHWNPKNLVCYALAAHQLRKDFDIRYGDEVTQKLLDFLDVSFLECFLERLFEQSQLKPGQYNNDTGLDEADQALIRAHFTQPMPKGGNEKVARAEVLALLRQHLSVDENKQITELQPYYELFFYGGGQAETMVCYRLLKRVPLQIMPLLARLFELLVALAPQRIINYIAHMETDDATADFDDELKRIDFFDHLATQGIPCPAILAYQAMNPTDDDDEDKDYQRLVSLYSEIDNDDNSMFGSMYKQQATDLAEGLKRVPQQQRVSFYHAVHKKFPEMGFRAEAEFWSTLQRFIKKNTVSWDEKLVRQFSAEETVYFGDIDEFVTELPIMRDANTIADQRFTTSRFEHDVLVMQQRGEAWYLLKHDKDLKFEVLQGQYIRPVTSYCARVLVLTEEVTADKIAQMLTPQQPELNRTERIFSELSAYLNGQGNFTDIQALCRLELDPALKSVADYYGDCGLENFIWKLDAEFRDRLVQLLIHISAKGIELVAEQHSENDRFDSDDCDDDEQQTALLAYLLSQQPPMSHLVKYCIDSDEDVFHQYLIHLGREGVLFSETGELSVKKRLLLLDMFDEYDDTESLIAHFKDDPSRKVSSRAKQLLQ